MGGGGQSNSQQASQAAQQQSAANAQDMAISQQNSALQKRMVDTLFGTGTGSGPGSTGTLSGFLNPANLNQQGLNSNYQTQFNEGKDQLSQSTAQQRGSLAQQFANSGASASSTPNGFMANQMNQLSRNQADAQGQLYSTLKGSQYSDALNNFWNASNIASGNAATAAGTATSSAGNSGSSSAQIYGTAGQYHPGQILPAVASVGSAAMCPADGSMILMADNSLKKIEQLLVGDRVLGIDRRGDEVIDIQPTMRKVCIVFTPHQNVTVSDSHTFERHAGGYSFAMHALGETLDLEGGPQTVVEVRPLAEEKLCRHIMLKRSHGYCCDGFWSLE